MEETGGLLDQMGMLEHNDSADSEESEPDPYETVFKNTPEIVGMLKKIQQRPRSS